MVNIRKIIADRLGRELSRKGLTADRVARDSEIPLPTVHDYLSGSKELVFAELRPICDVIGIDLMRLAAPREDKPQLIYRQTGPLDRQAASRIENAFLLVRDDLPTPAVAPVRLDPRPDTDRNWLIANVNRVVEDLRNRYPTLESLIEGLQIPVLPITGADNGFDAFLLSCKPHYVICLNMSKPTVRIHFSALHEIAHYLFDANANIPLDQDIESSACDLYRDIIPLESVSEFRANKFAQIYSVPLSEAEQMSRNLNRSLDLSRIDTSRVSADVVSNSVFDLARLHSGVISLNAIKSKVMQAVPTWGGDTALRPFLVDQGQRLRARIASYRDEFSDEVWATVAQAWEILDV